MAFKYFNILWKARAEYHAYDVRLVSQYASFRTRAQHGEKPGKLSYRVAEDTGMSYRWVMEYLPDHLKTRPGLGGPVLLLGQRARSATIDLEKLVAKPQGKTLVVRTYANANSVQSCDTEGKSKK